MLHAALESICFQTMDVVEAMSSDTGDTIESAESRWWRINERLPNATSVRSARYWSRQTSCLPRLHLWGRLLPQVWRLDFGMGHENLKNFGRQIESTNRK